MWLTESNRIKHFLYAIRAEYFLPSYLSEVLRQGWNLRISNMEESGIGWIFLLHCWAVLLVRLYKYV